MTPRDIAHDCRGQTQGPVFPVGILVALALTGYILLEFLEVAPA